MTISNSIKGKQVQLQQPKLNIRYWNLEFQLIFLEDKALEPHQSFLLPTYNLSWDFAIKGNRIGFPLQGAKLDRVEPCRAEFLTSFFLTCRVESSLVSTQSSSHQICSPEQMLFWGWGWQQEVGGSCWQMEEQSQACSKPCPGNGSHALSSMLTWGEAEPGTKGSTWLRSMQRELEERACQVHMKHTRNIFQILITAAGNLEKPDNWKMPCASALL